MDGKGIAPVLNKNMRTLSVLQPDEPPDEPPDGITQEMLPVIDRELSALEHIRQAREGWAARVQTAKSVGVDVTNELNAMELVLSSLRR